MWHALQSITDFEENICLKVHCNNIFLMLFYSVLFAFAAMSCRCWRFCRGRWSCGRDRNRQGKTWQSFIVHQSIWFHFNCPCISLKLRWGVPVLNVNYMRCNPHTHVCYRSRSHIFQVQSLLGHFLLCNFTHSSFCNIPLITLPDVQCIVL